MYAVELKKITKRFAHVLANDRVDFNVTRGTIHALVGENGAGKSTLMKVLYGVYQPDEGEIRINGETISIDQPRTAIQHGIGMVHQHFMLIPPLTITENIVLGDEPHRRFGKLDFGRAEETIRKICESFSLEIDPRAKVSALSVGLQQKIEIVKVLYRNAEILILDEPTAVLTPQETFDLFGILRNLQHQGKTIVLITHKLNEVMSVSDSVSVMRRGRMIGEVQTCKTTREEIAFMMVGRNISQQLDKAPFRKGLPVLEVKDLVASRDRGQPPLKNITFEVHAGEILGVAGVEGNGQTELVEILTGLREAKSGSIRISGRETMNLSPKKILGSNLSHIPEDRLRRGLVLDYSVADNLILGRHLDSTFSGQVFLHRDQINLNAEEMIHEYDIRPNDKDVVVRSMSGGNQQKVIIARELSRNAQLIVANQPTRGVDIGSIEFVHQQILLEREAGKAVLLVSADLSEVMSLSDRIAVMYGGEIIGIFDADERSEGEIGLMMTGKKS
jgi:simple sugar transport system ATP-binding protein